MNLLTPARYYLGPLGTEATRVAFGDPPGARLSAASDARAANPPSPIGYWWQLAAATRWSSRPWLREIDRPTLVLAGERDPVAPVASARFLAEHIPGARLHVFRDAGHSFLLEQGAREPAAVVNRFLDEARVRAEAR